MDVHSVVGLGIWTRSGILPGFLLALLSLTVTSDDIFFSLLKCELNLRKWLTSRLEQEQTTLRKNKTAQERRIFSKDYWGWIKQAHAPTLKGFPQQNLLQYKHQHRTNPGWLETPRIAMLYEVRKPHLNHDLEKKRIKFILAESS